jgi:hypothetical protein
MNILDARILLKRSTTAGVVPTIPASATHTDGSWINTDIYSGEAFLNTVDQRMYVRTGANIKEITFQNNWVGQSFGGGVIFHTYRDASNVEHGLIVSIVDQSTSSPWSDITSASVGITTTWNGQANTNLMKAQTGATSGAWKDADDYSYGGFTDWYLPAIDELILMSNNRFAINKTLSTIGGSNQLQNLVTYWSSTQDYSFPNNQARVLDFGFMTGDMAGKNLNRYVRAIRQF